MLGGEPGAGAGESGLHLVGDEDDAVVPRPRGERGKESGCGHDESALTLDGLDDDRGQRLRTDLGFDAGDRPPRRFLAGQTRLVTQRVGGRHPVDLGREGPELRLVGHRLGGQRHRQVGAAVVGVVEGNDRRTAGGQPRHLDRVLHGLGAGVEQCGALVVIAGSQGVEELGDLHVSLVGRHHETGVGEVSRLVGDGGGDGGVGGAHGGDRDTRPEVDEGVAVGVDDHATIGINGVDGRGRADPGGYRRATALGQGTGTRPRQGRHDVALLCEAVGDVGHGTSCRRSGDLSVSPWSASGNGRFVHRWFLDTPFWRERPPASTTWPPIRRAERCRESGCGPGRSPDS